LAVKGRIGSWKVVVGEKERRGKRGAPGSVDDEWVCE
jgi:hypothetical protein